MERDVSLTSLKQGSLLFRRFDYWILYIICYAVSFCLNFFQEATSKSTQSLLFSLLLGLYASVLYLKHGVWALLQSSRMQSMCSFFEWWPSTGTLKLISVLFCYFACFYQNISWILGDNVKVYLI